MCAIRVIQAFTTEEDEHRRFVERRARESLAANLRLYMLQTVLLGRWSTCSSPLGTAAVLWVGAPHVLDGTLTIGAACSSSSTYLASLYAPINSLMQTCGLIQGAARRRARGCSRSSRRSPTCPTARARSRATTCAARSTFEDVRFEYDAGRARCCATSTSHARAGRAGGDRRADRRRQDARCVSLLAPLLRSDGGPRAPRRRRRARVPAARAAPADRDGAPAAAGLPDDAPREHRLRPPATRRRTRSSRGRAPGAARRLRSARCRRAPTPWSASRARRSPTASSSASRSRARSCATRRS